MVNVEMTYDEGRERFMQMYEQRREALVDFAAAVVARRDVAEDLVQELFTRLWERSADLSNVNEGYLFTSVRNAAIDYLRRTEQEERCMNELDRTEEDTSEWEEQLDEEVMNLLFQEIDRLPERCREIFLLHLDGLSNDEIAERLELSVLTVKTQKKRAMKKLREYFDEED